LFLTREAEGRPTLGYLNAARALDIPPRLARVVVVVVVDRDAIIAGPGTLLRR